MKKSKKLSQKQQDCEIDKSTIGKEHEPIESNFGPIRFVEKINKDGEAIIDFDFKTFSKGVQNTTGAHHLDFGSDLILQVIAATCKNKTLEVEKANAVTSALSEIKPKSALEGMMAVQMVIVHNQAMRLLSYANNTTFNPQIELYLNLANKLLRTFISQFDALTKCRRNGQQKVTVEHVHINEGGQAIVGTVSEGGGGNIEK